MGSLIEEEGLDTEGPELSNFNEPLVPPEVLHAPVDEGAQPHLDEDKPSDKSSGKLSKMKGKSQKHI